MSYIFETVTGNASALAFHFNGQFAIKNYDVEIVNGNRLKVVSTQNEMFSLLEADVSEVEINGIVYSDPLAAQFALKSLVSSTIEPVVMTKEMYMELSAAVQTADRGKLLPTTPMPSGGWLSGWYTPGIFENSNPGTNYPNQNNLKAKKGFITKFIFNGVIWDFLEYEMPEASVNVRKWEDLQPSDFPLNENSQVVFEKILWIVDVDKTANSLDVPNDKSEVWVSLGGNDRVVKNNLKSFIEDGVEDIITDFKAGYYDTDGKYNPESSTRSYRFEVKNIVEITMTGGFVGSQASPYVGVMGVKDGVYIPIFYGVGETVTDKIMNVQGYDEIIINFSISSFPNPTVKSFSSNLGITQEDSVMQYINGMSFLDEKVSTVISIENISFGISDLQVDDSAYVGSDGNRISSGTAVNKSIEVKVGDTINFRGNRLTGQPSYVIVNADKSIIVSEVNTSSYSLELNIAKNGVIYFNQPKNTDVIDVFLLNRQKLESVKSIKDYIELGNGNLRNSTLKTLNSEGVFEGYYNVKNAIVGKSHYKDYIPNPDYLVSALFPVRKGDNLLLSGFFGDNGIALFGKDGKLLKKLFYSVDMQHTDTEIFITEDGFVHYSYKKTQPFGLKIFDRKLVEAQKLIKDKLIKIEKPKFARIDLDGDLPTDLSPSRLPTTLEFTLSVANEKKINAKVKLSIQGSGSAAYPKKGYTFDVINFQDEKVSIKFGDLVAADSFHLKAYQSDRTHTRDIGMGRIWRDMIYKNAYPISKVNNIPFALKPTAENSKYIADAKYHTDGFPTEVYINGVFLGLFTFRLKKTRENYALNNAIKEHIFLDNGDYEAFFTTGFVPSKWEIKSPKMTGYVDMGDVPDATVLAYINRFFNWTIDFKNNTGSARANAADYIVVKNWIDYKIFCEVFFHHDSIGNNINCITWNGNQWSFCPYDMDFTIGFWHMPAWEMITTRTGFITGDIWDSFMSYFLPQIKIRFTELRKSGFLTTDVLGKYFDDIAKDIPRSVYEADSKKWDSLFLNGEPTIEHIKLFLKNRIDWLDSQWLNP